MAGVLPDIVFLLMALGALVDASIRRGRAEKAERRARSLDLLGGLALLVRELGVSTGDLFRGRRIIRHRIVERDVTVCLLVELSVVGEVDSKLAKIFGLAIGVGQCCPVEMLCLSHVAELVGANDGVNLGVLSSKQLSLILGHIGKGEHEVHLLLEIWKNTFGGDERVVYVKTGNVIFLGCG